MTLSSTACLFISLAIPHAAPTTSAASQDPTLKLELFAHEPDIVTPIGVAFDRRGKLLVIESHTHFRPKNYSGPPHDRLRWIEDTDGNGKADKFTTFYEGSDATMAVHPVADGTVLVASRSEIFRLHDADGNDVADKRTTLAKLVTTGNYPHNGLSAVMTAPDGRILFGMGENLGVPWSLVGSDGRTIKGGGEGGNVFECAADGTGLRRLATGFWNPFSLAFDTAGNLFAVDNDPDARPPCRLLHVVPGADYGFQFRHGRRGRHPFTSWNGELPGTLGMVAGTGEAPSGLFYGHDPRLPPSCRGRWIVTSWGDHRIESYQLTPRGATFDGTMTPLVTGGSDFRPVGIAVAPDGSIFFSDWVSRSYEVHGQGRIWKLSPAPSVVKGTVPEIPRTEAAQWIADASSGKPMERVVLRKQLDHPDPFVRTVARFRLEPVSTEELKSVWAGLTERQQAEYLRATLFSFSLPSADPSLSRDDMDRLLKTAGADARFLLIQWIGEGRKQEHRSIVEQQLVTATTPPMLDASLATLDLLNGREARAFDDGPPADLLMKLVTDSNTSTLLRRHALRRLPVGYPNVTVQQLVALANAGDEKLAVEAIRTLRDHPNRDERVHALTEMASDMRRPFSARAEAIAGLSAPSDRGTLLKLLPESEEDIALEILASLQGNTLSEKEKEVVAHWSSAQTKMASTEWKKAVTRLLAAPGSSNGEGLEGDKLLADWKRRIEPLLDNRDAAHGARIFFHPSGPGCYKCHAVLGRGARIGPELTGIAARQGFDRVLSSIVLPNREVAPMYIAWVISLDDGSVFTGSLTRDDTKRLSFALSDGTSRVVERDKIESQRASSESIMPARLHEQLDPLAMRHLIQFLEEDSE